MADLRVYKTLVVGLGSTGTRVCNALAERIEWEVGSLERAPWVEFLCIETNASEKSRFNPGDNFKTLTIDAAEYSDLIGSPQNYNESIALERWADVSTLRQLKAGAVDAGAGNIRMVGRLALLYPKNYTNIKNALTDRLARLRNLTPAEAKTKLNQNAIGLETDVIFADGVRVIVTGTLLGGTCSGTASDFGILLQTISRKEERLMGIFTLPHPGYTIANDSSGLAELRKTNAYHALQELNQYHNNTDRDRYSSIKFPDIPYGQEILKPDETPYDLVYLVRSREITADDEQKLNGAVADRVFLNIFAPEADPMATIVDGGVTPPKNGRSFAFATFGLSAIEYPVRRIIEACKLKTLVHAFRKWRDRSLEGKLEDHLDDLGLTQPNLLELLLREESGSSVRPRLDAKLREVVNAARRGETDNARKKLEELRSAFVRDKGDAFKGLAVRTLELNRTRAANEIINNAAGLVRAKLLNYDIGPAPLAQILDGVSGRVGELRGWEPAEINPGASNGVLERIDNLKRNLLLRSFFLRSKAISRLITGLNRALNDEAKARLEQAAKNVLRDSGSGVRTDAGTLRLIEEDILKIRKRVQNLNTRLNSQTLDWTGQVNELEGRESDVNGLALFEPAPNGTVDKEFKGALSDTNLERLSAEIVRGWTDLPRALVPTGNDPDWLMQPHIPGRPIFEPTQLHALEELAVEPFRPLSDPNNKNVVTRLFDAATPTFSPDQEAMAAARAAAVFLPIKEELGQPDPMSPLPKKKLLLGRNLTDKFTNAITSWRSATPIARQNEISNPFRIIMLEEWYKFSLRGSLDITGALANAKSTLYPTYYTRKREDIDWTPISDSEVAQLHDAEELLIFGVLNEVLRLEYGYLVMDWPEGPGEPRDAKQRQRRFPVRLDKAARMLAFSEKDATDKSLNGVRTRLNALIDSKYKTGFVNEYKEQSEADQHYVRYLQKQLLEGNGPAITGWDHAKITRMMVNWLKKRGLLKALYTVYPPEDALIQSMWRRSGDARPLGNGFFDKDGYYCAVCGGPVGYTRDEALENGLVCQFNPEGSKHPFSREWDPFQNK
jgi:hypothetical protein